MKDYAFHLISLVLLIYTGICIIYFLIQERFIFVPLNFPEIFKPTVTTTCDEITIATTYGGSIHGLLIRKAKAKGLIFYLHGNTGNLKRWQFMAEELADYGYDVFTIDYRGYGHSTGNRSEASMHRDVETCFDEITSRFDYQRKIIYGRSLGAAFATRLAARRKASLLILETPFLNMHFIGKYYLPFLPTKYLLRYRFRSDLYIQNVTYPIHIFHGTSDRVVPHNHAQRLYSLAKNSSRTVNMTTINGGKHSNLNSFPLFRKKMEELLY
jgi:hypothetical protein